MKRLSVSLLFALLCFCAGAQVDTFYKSLGKLYYYTDEGPTPTLKNGELYDHYIKANMVIPQFYKQHNIAWHTNASFIIDTAGKMVHINRGRDFFYEAQDELKKIIAKIPAGNPGYVDGKPVNVTVIYQADFGDLTEPTRVTAESKTRYLKSKKRDNQTLDMVRSTFDNIFDLCIAQDPTLKSGDLNLRFAVDSNSNLIYQEIKGDTAACAIAQFALQHLVVGEKYDPWLYSSGHYLDWRRKQRVMDSKDTFYFSALDTFEITAHLNVTTAPNESTTAEHFMNEKGDFKKITGIVPDFRIEHPGIITPPYKVEQSKPAKMVKCAYRIEDAEGSGRIKTVTWYDSTGQRIKVDYCWADMRNVTYFNPSTGKNLEFDYLSHYLKRVPDSSGLRKPLTTVPLGLDKVIEHGYNAPHDSMVTRGIFPISQYSGFTKPLDTLYYYNKNGYADSAHAIYSGEYFMLKFSYNKKNQLIEMRLIDCDNFNRKAIDDTVFYNYTYTGQGNIKSLTVLAKQWSRGIDRHAAKLALVTKAWYDYDAQNRPVKYTFVYIQNNPRQNDTSVAVYTYSPGTIVTHWTERKQENVIEQHFNQYGYLISDVRYAMVQPDNKHTIVYDYDYY